MKAPLSWPIALGEPPEVDAIGRGLHGIEHLEERYLLQCWSIHFYGDEGYLVLDGHRLTIEPGYVGVIAPGVRQEHHFQGRAEHLYAHFRPTASADRSDPFIAAMRDLGDDFGRMFQRFDDLRRTASARPQRAAAGLWDILWELSERTLEEADRRERRHSAVSHACRAVETRLAEPLHARDVALTAGVSTSRLNSLFRAHFDETVTEHVRRKRVERARHLLLHSDLSIKQVACEVGLSNLQRFNKVIRRTYGLSPRGLRAEGPAAGHVYESKRE